MSPIVALTFMICIPLLIALLWPLRKIRKESSVFEYDTMIIHVLYVIAWLVLVFLFLPEWKIIIGV